MIVISDNSALSALAEAGLIGILPLMFGEVVIPEAVRLEGARIGAPEQLRALIGNPPEWLRFVPDPKPLLPETANLGQGEAAAITLAWNHRVSSRLILDERRGRRVAQALGLRLTGALGLVGDAAKQGLADFEESVSKLKTTGFHMDDAVVDVVRRRLG